MKIGHSNVGVFCQELIGEREWTENPWLAKMKRIERFNSKSRQLHVFGLKILVSGYTIAVCFWNTIGNHKHGHAFEQNSSRSKICQIIPYQTRNALRKKKQKTKKTKR